MLEPGQFYSGFIEGFDVFADEVSQAKYDDYFGQAIDFYDNRTFKVIQILYPTSKGVWPWAEDAPHTFKSWQPILAAVGRA